MIERVTRATRAELLDGQLCLQDAVTVAPAAARGWQLRADVACLQEGGGASRFGALHLTLADGSQVRAGSARFDGEARVLHLHGPITADAAMGHVGAEAGRVELIDASAAVEALVLCGNVTGQVDGAARVGAGRAPSGQ